jgi:mRNA interferase MazF
MTFGIKYEQGDIVVVPFPFTDLSEVKQRPVFILSKKNASLDVITCGITSHLKDTENSILITSDQLASGEIPTTSRIKVDKLFTLESSIILKKIGKL